MTWDDYGSRSVKFDLGDRLSLPFSSNPDNPIFTSDLYETISNFGRTERENLYTKESMDLWLESGNVEDLIPHPDRTVELPENFIWPLNFWNNIFSKDN